MLSASLPLPTEVGKKMGLGVGGRGKTCEKFNRIKGAPPGSSLGFGALRGGEGRQKLENMIQEMLELLTSS